MKDRVLIIDDDNRNIFALQAVLSAKGYSCYTAASASEGLRLLGEGTNVGIVLLDMMMPDLDGYEAIRIIRNNTDTSKIPVIAVTAQAMPGDRQKCIDAGANDYISKPIDVDVLVQYLHKYLKN